MIAAAQRRQKNERIYLTYWKGLLSKSNLQVNVKNSIEYVKKHLGDFGSILDFVSFGHISQSFWTSLIFLIK